MVASRLDDLSASTLEFEELTPSEIEVTFAHCLRLFCLELLRFCFGKRRFLGMVTGLMRYHVFCLLISRKLIPSEA